LTGSYTKTVRSGQKGTTYNPPSSTEFEPLGAIVPQTDPYINDDELGGSLTPPNYQFGGNVHSPESGCTVDRMPIPCNLLRDSLRYWNVRSFEVNTRIEGGWSAYHELRGSIRRYDIYRRGDIGEDTSSDDGDIIKVNSSLTYLGSMYMFLTSPFWEKAIQNIVLVPNDLKQKVIDRLDKDNKKCRDFLDKVRGKLKIKETFEDLFDEVIKKGGNFVLDTTLLGTTTAGISRTGKKGRDVGLRPSSDADTYINVVLHELIPRAEISSHTTFAKAGFNALSADEQNAAPRPTDDDVKKINKANKKAGIKDRTDLDRESSTYFSKLMNKFCGQ